MKNAALKVSGTIFLSIAILHLARLYFKTAVLVGGAEIPSMTSIAGAIISLLLAVWMFAVAKR